MTVWREFLSTACGANREWTTPVLDLLDHALAGWQVDVNSTDWAAAMQRHQANIPLTGCINRAWEVWRHYMPDRSDTWDDILRMGWKDRKLDLNFRYDLHQGFPPTGAPSADDIIMGRELDKLNLLGVTALVSDAPAVPGHPTHIMKHGLVPKLNEDGHPSGDHRMILRPVRQLERGRPVIFRTDGRTIRGVFFLGLFTFLLDKNGQLNYNVDITEPKAWIT